MIKNSSTAGDVPDVYENPESYIESGMIQATEMGYLCMVHKQFRVNSVPA
jgi:hypothetical protein